MIATTLVQVGIRHYDGAYWPHLAQELSVPAIQPLQQGELGRAFVKALRQHGKSIFDESKYVSSILLHGLVSNHYADRFFDFLFSYYELDLEREISRAHISDLSSSILDASGAKRTYMLVQQTADAVKANPKGMKIRMRRFLGMIDKAFWDSSFRPKGASRMNGLFWDWIHRSENFKPENRGGPARGRAAGKRAFSSPFFSVSLRDGTFILYLPAQQISFGEPVGAGVSWRIRCGESSVSQPCEVYQAVTSYKTEEQALPWSQALLFLEASFELFCGDHRLRTFKIAADDCRFFDADARLIVARFLPSGRIYAVSQPGYDISSSGYLESGSFGGLKLSSLQLEQDDVVFLSGGRIASSGGRFEEGLMRRGRIAGASLLVADEALPIYSNAPAVILRLQESQAAGTLVCMDEERFRLEDIHSIRFPLEDRSSETGFYINLKQLLAGRGIHSVHVDAPRENRRRQWRFAYLEGFGYEFETNEGDELPYVFQRGGTVRFRDLEDPIAAECADVDEIPGERRFNFPILSGQDGLIFRYSGHRLRLEVPAVFWRFNGDSSWHVEPPHQIWHRDLPDSIFFYGTSETVSLCMAEGSDEFEENQEVAAARNAQSGALVCDMTRFHTWITRENLLETINLRVGKWERPFIQVITRSACLSGFLEGDCQNGVMRAKFNIIGHSEYFLDLRYGDTELANKTILKDGILEVQIPLNSGLYEAEVFEREEDDSGFGEAEYHSIYLCETRLINPYLLEDNTLQLLGVRSQDAAVQSFALEENYRIELNQRTEQNTYRATLRMDADDPKDRLSEQVIVEFPDIGDLSACQICYCEEGDDEPLCYLLDQRTHRIVREEDRRLHRAVRYRRYRLLDQEDLFNVRFIEKIWAATPKRDAVPEAPEISISGTNKMDFAPENAERPQSFPKKHNQSANLATVSSHPLSLGDISPTLADAGLNMLTVNRAKSAGILTVGDLLRRVATGGFDCLKHIHGMDKKSIHELIDVYYEYASKG